MWGVKLMQKGCAMTYTVIYIFYCFLYSTYTLQICTKQKYNKEQLALSISFTSWYRCDINTEAQ